MKANEIKGKRYLIMAAAVCLAGGIPYNEALAYNSLSERFVLAIEEGACLLREVQVLGGLTSAEVGVALDDLADEAARLRLVLLKLALAPTCFEAYSD